MQKLAGAQRVASEEAAIATFAQAVLNYQAQQRAALAARQTAARPVARGSVSASGIWGCVIAHESGGNPSAVNPSSGAGGLFQFLPSSWAAYGGTGLPENASVAEQWAIAEHAQAVSGWSPWVGDGCTPLG
jgi:hypothetical protein